MIKLRRLKEEQTNCNDVSVTPLVLHDPLRAGLKLASLAWEAGANKDAKGRSL